MAQTKNRKKVNFMIDKNILVRIVELLPAGKRSDFVNEALTDAIIHYGRKRASDEMDKLREKMKLRMTTKEIIKLKNYGRP